MKTYTYLITDWSFSTRLNGSICLSALVHGTPSSLQSITRYKLKSWFPGSKSMLLTFHIMSGFIKKLNRKICIDWIDWNILKVTFVFENVKNYLDLGRSNESAGAEFNSTFHIYLR